MNSITASKPQEHLRKQEEIKDFFYQAGLFTIPQFFNSELCRRLRDEACQSLSSLTQQVISRDEQPEVNSTIDRIDEKQISPDLWETFLKHLATVKSQLELYFQTELSEMKTPNFGRFNQGHFLNWHVDVVDKIPATKDFKITILVYLNGQDEKSNSEGFLGGELEILVPQEEYKNHCLQISPQTGLLVAFDSHTPHQVQPIVKGSRYVIATCWK